MALYMESTVSHSNPSLITLSNFQNPKPFSPLSKSHCGSSFLTLISSTTSLSLRVPLPIVLLDADSAPIVKVLADHVEVKLLLLLPVDHSVLSSLHSPQSSPLLQPLAMENDVAKCSSVDKVDFYCRSCGIMLTKNPLSYVTDNPGGDGVDQGTENFGLNGERTLTCIADEVNCAFDENSLNPHHENGKLSANNWTNAFSILENTWLVNY